MDRRGIGNHGGFSGGTGSSRPAFPRRVWPSRGGGGGIDVGLVAGWIGWVGGRRSFGLVGGRADGGMVTWGRGGRSW